MHLTSSSQLVASYLSPLLTALTTTQAPHPPSAVVLLLPSSMSPSSTLLSSLPSPSLISTASYPPDTAPVVAFADTARDRVQTAYVVVVDGHVRAAEALQGGYVRALLHAAGTAEYRAALLTAGGVALPAAEDGEGPPHGGGECVFPRATAQRITAPSLPFLLPTSWLLPRDPSSPSSSVLQGLSTSLPLELALSAALWTKHAIPTYALPLLPPSSSSPGSSTPPAAAASAPDGSTCSRLQRSLLSVPRAAHLFAPAQGGGAGLRALQAAGDRAKGGGGAGRGAREWTLAEKAEEARAERLATGQVVLVLSGREEVDAVRRMACRMAGSGAGGAAAGAGAGAGGLGGAAWEDGDGRAWEDGATTTNPWRGRRELRILVADYDPVRDREAAAPMGSCHLDLTPLSPSPSPSSAPTPSDEPVSLALVDALDALDPAPAFVLYLSDGPRAREFDEVLRWMGGVFGGRGGGGGGGGGGGEERLSRVRAEREMLRGVDGEAGGAGARGRGRPTVVAMTTEEARRAEWVGALDLEALRRESRTLFRAARGRRRGLTTRATPHPPLPARAQTGTRRGSTSRS